MIKVYEITVTAPDVEWLAEFTRNLIKDRLAASGNVIRDVDSIYRWQGEVVERPEAMVLLHTGRPILVERIIERVKAEHPYEVPGIRVSTLECPDDYGAWVEDSTR